MEITKKEISDIKNRLSALENRLDKLQSSDTSTEPSGNKNISLREFLLSFDLLRYTFLFS